MTWIERAGCLMVLGVLLIFPRVVMGAEGRRIFSCSRDARWKGKGVCITFPGYAPYVQEKGCVQEHMYMHTHTCLHRYTGTYTCMHTDVYAYEEAHEHTAHSHCPQLKTQVLTALSPTLFFTCHHSQRKGEPHRGAGKMQAGAGEMQVRPGGQASERHLSGSAHSGPGTLPLRPLQAPEGRAVPPPRVPANPKAACSGSNPWASDSGKGRISKHHTSSQPVKIQNPPVDPGLRPG